MLIPKFKCSIIFMNVWVISLSFLPPYMFAVLYLQKLKFYIEMLIVFNNRKIIIFLIIEEYDSSLNFKLSKPKIELIFKYNAFH